MLKRDNRKGNIPWNFAEPEGHFLFLLKYTNYLKSACKKTNKVYLIRKEEFKKGNNDF